MASYTTTTTIDTGGTKGILSATKSGTYNEVVNITQVINNTDIFIPISSGSSTKSSFTHSMSDCKSMIIKNSGVSGAEIQLKTYQNTHGTPDVTASETFHSYLLGAGEYIYETNVIFSKCFSSQCLHFGQSGIRWIIQGS